MKKKLVASSIILWLLFVALFLINKGIIPGWKTGRSDFSNYFSASVLFMEGNQISTFYDDAYFDDKSKSAGVKYGAKFAPFPPISAFIMIPLTGFNEPTAKRIWLLFDLVLLSLLLWQIKRFTGFSWLHSTLFLSIAWIPIASEIKLGQVYLLMSNLIFGFLLLERAGKIKLASSLLAIGASIKYFPVLYLVMVPVFNRKKVWTIFILTLILVSLLPAFIQGFDVFLPFLQFMTKHLNADVVGQNIYALGIQSIDSLLANLFVFHQMHNPNPFIDLPVLRPIVKMGIALLILISTLAIFRKYRQAGKEQLVNISIAIVGFFALSPIATTYHFLLLLPALAIIYMWMREKINPQFLIVMIGITFFSMNILPHHIPWVESLSTINLILHYPRVYSLLILFGLLVYLRIGNRWQLANN